MKKFVFRKYLKLEFKFKFQVFPSHEDRKTNSFVCLLGEVTARQFCSRSTDLYEDKICTDSIQFQDSSSGSPWWWDHDQLTCQAFNRVTFLGPFLAALEYSRKLDKTIKDHFYFSKIFLIVLKKGWNKVFDKQ